MRLKLVPRSWTTILVFIITLFIIKQQSGTVLMEAKAICILQMDAGSIYITDSSLL